MAKINKALDLNKLFSDQRRGKLLKKHLKFPMYGSIKYDGNYCVVIKQAHGLVTYHTSGGHEYTNSEPTIFDEGSVAIGVYICERIGTDGKLGDRTTCSLRGPRGNQVAHGHTYKVHHYMSLEDYTNGKDSNDYGEVLDALVLDSGIPHEHLELSTLLHTQEDVDSYLKEVVADGYEGIMLKHPSWYWEDTKSRKVSCVKYKSRPTVDLLVIGAEEGVGKYENMIGALVLQDSKGRIVSVGSGMSDADRCEPVDTYIGKVVEVFYEQIIDTYIQPTFGSEYEGILIRHDKTEEEID